MRDLGGNISWKADAKVLLSAQLVSRWTGASNDGNLELDYAFADATLHCSLFAELQHVTGVAWLSKISNPPAQLGNVWDMVLLRAAFHF